MGRLVPAFVVTVVATLAFCQSLLKRDLNRCEAAARTLLCTTRTSSGSCDRWMTMSPPSS